MTDGCLRDLRISPLRSSLHTMRIRYIFVLYIYIYTHTRDSSSHGDFVIKIISRQAERRFPYVSRLLHIIIIWWTATITHHLSHRRSGLLLFIFFSFSFVAIYYLIVICYYISYNMVCGTFWIYFGPLWCAQWIRISNNWTNIFI